MHAGGRSGTGAVTTIPTKNLRRGFRSRSLILMGVVGPLVLGTLLALAFGGRGPSITIALVDLDRSTVSRSITDGLADALEGSQIDLVVRGPGTDAPRLVRDETVEAAVVIPEGYGSSLAATPEALRVVRSAENSIGASVADGFAEEIASAADLKRAVAAGMVSAGLDPAPVVTGQGLQPVLRVQMRSFGSRFDVPMYFGPLAVFLFLGLGASARQLLRDERDGILDRIRAAPVGPRSIVAGSSGAVIIQGILASTVVVLVSTLLFGASWGAPSEVVVILGCFVVSLAGLVGLVVGVARTDLQAESWTNVTAFLFAIVGGAFFGGARLPGVLGFIGTLTPNGAAMRALVEAGPGGRSLGEIWYLLAWMLVVGIVGLVVGGSLLERRLR